MWGDPIGAASLNQIQSTSEQQEPTSSEISSCAASLLQITGPAHISLADTRWQEFFLHYNILAHLDLNRIPSSPPQTTVPTNSGTLDHAVNHDDGHRNSSTSSLVGRACMNMNQHAQTSSNLAAMALHIMKMLIDLEKSCIQICCDDGSSGGSSSSHTHTTTADTNVVDDDGSKSTRRRKKGKAGTTASSVPVSLASQRIALVGKARVTCGALNIFRILVHEVIVAACHNDTANTNDTTRSGSTSSSSAEYLKEAFLYQSRNEQQNHHPNIPRAAMYSNDNTTPTSSSHRDTTVELLSSVLSFISTMGGNHVNPTTHMDHSSTTTTNTNGSSSSTNTTPTTSTNNNNSSTKKMSNEKELSKLTTSIPELYDVTVQCLSLLTVLFSTQLYQPMQSSFQSMTKEEELFKDAEGEEQEEVEQDDLMEKKQQQQQQRGGPNLFLNLVMQEAIRNQHLQKKQNHSKRRYTHDLHDENSSFSSQSTSYKSSKQYSLSSSRSTYKQQQQKQQQQQQQQQQVFQPTWSSQSILSSCLDWFIERPAPPSRSISGHIAELGHFIAQDIKKQKIGADGMYETHSIVMARAPRQQSDKRGNSGTGGNSIPSGGSGTGLSSPLLNNNESMGSSRQSHLSHHNRSAPKIILDATNKVIHISSSLLLLPLRLMTIAIRLLGHQGRVLLGGQHHPHGEGEYDHARVEQLLLAFNERGGGGIGSTVSRTNDVLWLTDSPLADLSNSVFLILLNNFRASGSDLDGTSFDEDVVESIGTTKSGSNPFRSYLATLDDCRWETYKADNDFDGNDGFVDVALDEQIKGLQAIDLDENNLDRDLLLRQSLSPPKTLGGFTTNFESLFDVFASMLHNEAGSLMLYTILQSSPRFAASLAVRSDLEVLVIPLLRTLYFSSSTTHHVSGRTVSGTAQKKGIAGEDSSSAVTVMQRPFRSPSHLYVIMILLLIFSQDTSFGPDSFRRSNISNVKWYKERTLKDISLGSLLVLSLLRCITFNLNRIQDPFLLSNSCAVLLNLSPHIANLHSYAAMRLAAVTVSSMKRYTVLVSANGGRLAEDGDIASPLGMHAEVCRTLLQVVRHCIRRKVIGQNLHLVYSLVYMHRDFKTIMKAKRSPFKASDLSKVQNVMKEAEALIRAASARTADQAMDVLQKSVEEIKAALSGRRKARSRSMDTASTNNTTDSITTESTMTGLEDFTFTYEEEADPEIFFVPYVWEVIVCAVTGGSLEWNKDRIGVFPLLDYIDGGEVDSESVAHPPASENYAEDVADVV